ncbi:MAG: hypothetical protein ACI4N3_04405 [Alphaproteobacteria bacterium]
MTMIKINTLEIAGFAGALKALRLPFGKEMRSKAYTQYNREGQKKDNNGTWWLCNYGADVLIHPDDLKLMKRLILSGEEHAKVMRGIMVWAKIEAPIWFYREAETYRIGRERLSSESTMHIECRGLSGEELEKAKDKIPMGHIQKTVDVFSYQTLRRIYFQRRNHRLPMWHDFCRWIESLPYAKELIICEKENGK